MSYQSLQLLNNEADRIKNTEPVTKCKPLRSHTKLIRPLYSAMNLYSFNARHSSFSCVSTLILSSVLNAFIVIIMYRSQMFVTVIFLVCFSLNYGKTAAAGKKEH